MRICCFIAVAFLIIGCADVRFPYQDWPASVHQFVSVNGVESEALEQMIDSLNQDMGMTVVRIGGSVLRGYPITIEKVESLPNVNHVGYAKRYSDHCEIQLREDLFGNPNLLQSVFWHEVGHCAGLKHTDGANQIMSADASPFNKFSASAITSFFSALTTSIGL